MAVFQIKYKAALIPGHKSDIPYIGNNRIQKTAD